LRPQRSLLVRQAGGPRHLSGGRIPDRRSRPRRPGDPGKMDEGELSSAERRYETGDRFWRWRAVRELELPHQLSPGAGRQGPEQESRRLFRREIAPCAVTRQSMLTAAAKP